MKNIRVIFFIFILVFVIGGIYYFGGKAKRQNISPHNFDKINSSSSVERFGTLRDATTTPEEIADWGEFINNRVGWRFRYPMENLTRDIDEIIKFPSSEESQPKNEDLLEFAVGETVFRIKTYAEEGTSTIGTIEDWIKDSGKSASSNLEDYQKFSLAGNNAYNLKGKDFAYTFLNKNVYEISAYKDDENPLKIGDEPIFKKWISTINFFPEVRCWERVLPPQL
ncbi:MAG: hypothetical protein WC582_03275 [Patescibacteria group bacterium]